MYLVSFQNFLLMLNNLFSCFNASWVIRDVINVLDTTAIFSNKYIVSQINHKCCFSKIWSEASDISGHNIQLTSAVLKRNRFKKDVILDKRIEKHKRYSSKKKESIKKIKQNTSDYYTINFSYTVLSEEQ